MNRHKFTGRSITLLIFLLFQIIIMSSGCSTAPKGSISESSSPSLPSYDLGTTYVYSDGSWETVTDISPHLVTWHDHRGDVYSRSPDFTYGPANLQTQTRQISRRFVPRGDLLVQKNTSLWPLQEEKTANFTEMVTTRKNGEPQKSYQKNWTCQVIGTERITVMAGEFDTWKIACKRYSNYSNPSKAKIREIKTWNYAPKISHYVLTERQFLSGKPARRLELLAVLPPVSEWPASALNKMNKSFQMALEFKKSGKTVAWSVPNRSWSGRITPTATFKLADGRFSRRYIQKVKFADDERTYYGLAVRNSKGEWVVPRRH